MTTKRIPTAQAFSQLSTGDQGLILDLHLHQIEYEIDGLRTGYMWTTEGRSRAHHLQLLYARRRRLVRLAQSFGYWEDDDQAKTARA